MKISASLLSNQSKELISLIQELDRCYIDSFHIDCLDDMSIFEEINSYRGLSRTPIDLHLISATPEKYFEQIIQHSIEQVSIQYENIALNPLDIPKDNQIKWGLSITSSTPIDVFDQYKDKCSFILIMTTIPGESGGLFNKENFTKIRDFKTRYPNKEIYVDGGVNEEIAFVLRILGVTGIVSGSYLVNHQSIGEALLHLKSSAVHSDIKIEDFMIPRSKSPTQDMNSATIENIIRSIEKGNIGFTLIYGENYQLEGLVSNADLRKGLIKNLGNLNEMTVDDLINRNPISIHQKCSISELLDLVQKTDFLLSFLPVVDEMKRLTGALFFSNLISSET